METILEINKLSKDFGGLKALNDLDIKIRKGEIFGLIGPNGSGKTTLLNIITGYLKPNSGSIIYKGHSIGGLKPSNIAKKGIIRTFQITSTFSNLTADENVISGCYLNTNGTIWGSLFTQGRIHPRLDSFYD